MNDCCFMIKVKILHFGQSHSETGSNPAEANISFIKLPFNFVNLYVLSLVYRFDTICVYSTFQALIWYVNHFCSAIIAENTAFQSHYKLNKKIGRTPGFEPTKLVVIWKCPIYTNKIIYCAIEFLNAGC